ncbi:hypothetical protein GCM10011609_33520 [Lentzea pudingi]|uniref:YbaB/EbfC DNA-binding family protein n=1 Tax=Lentzea pudingi TaxID=1789439 RepID=A0ABQ2HX58_9PSEU|nr:hypothetical protein [Lentzea pudingi]GGM93342.1 hypothetical protein GCM10011609_33520 [Lentzea pudingi]
MLDKELSSLKLAELHLPPIAATRMSPPPELPSAPADAYKASDASRSLWVIVDPNGKVLRFDVSSSWQSRLPVAEFGQALMMTYLDAVRIAATVERQARRDRREDPEPVSFQSWSSMPDMDTWLAQIREEQSTIGRQLREACENADRVSHEVTALRSPYGLVTLQIRNGALVGLTANTAAISQAGVGQLQQDLWEVFGDAGLTSDRGTAPVSPPRRRSRAQEDPEEDLWKGLGAQ